MCQELRRKKRIFYIHTTYKAKAKKIANFQEKKEAGRKYSRRPKGNYFKRKTLDVSTSG